MGNCNMPWKGIKCYMGVGSSWEVKFLIEDSGEVIADFIIKLSPNPEITKGGIIYFDYLKFCNYGYTLNNVLVLILTNLRFTIKLVRKSLGIALNDFHRYH